MSAERYDPEEEDDEDDEKVNWHIQTVIGVSTVAQWLSAGQEIREFPGNRLGFLSLALLQALCWVYNPLLNRLFLDHVIIFYF